MDAINAVSVQAEIVDTVVVVDLAPAAGEAQGTVAGEGVEAVLADPAVVAGVGGAVVDVALAVGAGEAIHTGALIAVDPINADTVVVTGIGGALVNIDIAVFPRVACRENILNLQKIFPVMKRDARMIRFITNSLPI